MSNFSVPQGWGNLPPAGGLNGGNNNSNNNSQNQNQPLISAPPVPQNSAYNQQQQQYQNSQYHHHQHQQQESNNNISPPQEQQQQDATISRRPHFQSEMYISEPRELVYLTAADFQRPVAYPSALHVKPPTIAPHLRRPESRWSEHKYCNPQVPSYIPPELMLWGEGKPLQAFLDRARYDDMTRLHRSKVDGLFFMRKEGELPENFQARPYELMKELIEQRKEQLTQDRSRIKEMLAARAVNSDTATRFRDARGGSKLAGYGNLEYTSDGKIVHRLFFSKSVMADGRYGAIFGFRGTYHRQLERETGCRITLGGRGITNIKRVRNPQELEDAHKMLQYEGHACIVAPSEKELKDAVQRIEFLMSDDAEAVQTRADLKLKTEQGSGYQGAATKAAQEAKMLQQQNLELERKKRAENTVDGYYDENDNYYAGGEDDDDNAAEAFINSLKQ